MVLPLVVQFHQLKQKSKVRIRRRIRRRLVLNQLSPLSLALLFPHQYKALQFILFLLLGRRTCYLLSRMSRFCSQGFCSQLKQKCRCCFLVHNRKQRHLLVPGKDHLSFDLRRQSLLSLLVILHSLLRFLQVLNLRRC